MLYVDEDNICSLTKKNSVTSYSNLKDFIVLGELDELTEDHNKLKAIVIFLALVIQHARKTFMSEHLNQFKNKVLVWDLLIGVPVKNFDDKERMDILQYLLKLAWNASIRSNKIRFNDQELDDEKSDEVELNVQTEVDALLVSLDKQISNDYFIPIDVGAGTTDINFLRVGETSRESSYESKYASLAKSVEPYGSFMMLEDLCKQLDKKNEWAMKYLIKLYKNQDDWSNAIESLKAYLKLKKQDNNHMLALYNIQRGRSVLKNGDYSKSRQIFENVLELDSDMFISYYFLGNTYKEESNFIFIVSYRHIISYFKILISFNKSPLNVSCCTCFNCCIN